MRFAKAQDDERKAQMFKGARYKTYKARAIQTAH